MNIKNEIERIRGMIHKAYCQTGILGSIVTEMNEANPHFCGELDKLVCSLEDTAMSARYLNESCYQDIQPFEKTVMDFERHWSENTPFGKVEVDANGWLHITLNTLLPHCKQKSNPMLRDNLIRLLCGYKQKTGELPHFERAMLVIDEHCSIKSRKIYDQDNKAWNLPAGHPAKAPFDLIKETPVQNRANIIMGLGNRLGVFQNKLVDCITKYNDIDLSLPGQRPCAYYCIISDQDTSLEFLSSMFFSLLFSRLTNYARRYGTNGRLPVKVNVCLEEFCNIGYLGESFLRVLSVIRSRNVAVQLVIQGAAQLSGRYPHKEWEEIVGNCDWQIFLGCNDHMTADYISEKCGMVTIRTDSSQMPQQPLFSPVYGTTRPYSITRSSTQRALMMPDEIMQMDNNKCLVLIRGQRPLMLRKIIVEELPEYAALKPCRVVDHTPVWRDVEADSEKKRQEAEKDQVASETKKQEVVPPQEQPLVKKQRKKAVRSGENPENQQTLDGYYDYPTTQKGRSGNVDDGLPYRPSQNTVDDFTQALLNAQQAAHGDAGNDSESEDINDDDRGQ